MALPDRSLHQPVNKIFEDTLLKVTEQFEIKRKDPAVGMAMLAQFDELKKYETLSVHKVTEFRSRNGQFTVLLAEKGPLPGEQRKTALPGKEIEQVEPILIFDLPNDIGKAYIRRETLVDKVTDLFTRIDIDFDEFPAFSFEYFVMGEKPELVRKHLPNILKTSLEKLGNIIVEINGRKALLRSEKNLSENLLLLLISLGYQFTK